MKIGFFNLLWLAIDNNKIVKQFSGNRVYVSRIKKVTKVRWRFVNLIRVFEKDVN